MLDAIAFLAGVELSALNHLLLDGLLLADPSYRLKGRKLDLDLPDATTSTKSKSTDKGIDNLQPAAS